MPVTLRRLACLGLMFSSITHADPSSEYIKSLNLDWRNTNIQPEQNFYAYANGTWQKNNPIPSDYASWSIFNMLEERVAHQIQALLIAATHNKQAPVGSITQKVGDFYYSGMDEKNIDEAGLKPLETLFSDIEHIKNLQDLQTVITQLQGKGVDVLFNFGSMQDFKDSNKMIAAAFQGGLGLPDRDYYLEKNPKFVKIREAYVEHIKKMFILAGKTESQAQQYANQIMALETILAKASMTNTAMRNPQAIYHIMPLKTLDTLTPHFSWNTYFKETGLSNLDSMNVATPDFFKTMDKQLHTQSLETWKAYLTWHVLDSFASYLSQDFVNQNFHMVHILSGAKTLQPRWKRVIKTENQALGFAIGKLYVEQHFSAADKKQVQTMIKHIRETLAQEIKTLSWMTPSTRKAALKKLASMKDRVGYPDTWWDYSSLHIDRGPYVLNVMRANEFVVKRDLNKIGKPVDKNEWSMTPQTINAYYDPSMNNINLPAAILQPPMFNPKAPAAVNYGAIGFVIGHEMTHGFDDQGAKFDGHGNLHNWWSKTDSQLFQAATQCIATQFNQYKVDDLHLKGDLVVGEATADLGGLTLALKAYQSSKASINAPVIEGLTPVQQFFLSAAHVWSNNIRPEQAQNLATTDPHPPGLYRVNGTLANMPEFYKAFNIVTPGPMRNDKACVIW